MKMKKVFSVIVFCLFVNFAFAQEMMDREPKTPEEKAQMLTNHLDKKLALTADQKDKIYAINLDAAKKNDVLRGKMKDQSAEKGTFKEEKKSIEQSRDSQIEALLTAEQKPKYEEMKENAKNKMKDRMKNRKMKGEKDSNEDN